METTLSKVFSFFLSHDELRESLQNPFEINGYTYASDSYLLVRCKSEHIDFSYTNEHKPPNAESLIPKPNMSRLIDINNIDFDAFKTEDGYDIIAEVGECDACDGSGEVEFEFSHNGNDYEITHECPVCDGEGEMYNDTKKLNGKKTFPEGSAIKLGESLMCPRRMETLKIISELIGEPITLVYQDLKHRPSLFTCGILEILAIPLYTENPNVLTEI